MARWTVALGALLALLAVGASASRLPDNLLQTANDGLFSSLGVPLTGSQSNFANFWRGLLGRGRGKEMRRGEEGAYVTIRFIVPPSESEDFEEAWLKMEGKALDKEKGLTILELKKTKLDNLLYFAYGEWEDKMDLHDHIESNHFQDFADFVDKRGVRWSLELLENVSEELEEEQGIRRTKVERRRRGKEEEEELAHVLFVYIVPPNIKEDFISTWNDAAFSTIKEDANREIVLRKLATDNTKFYGCGTWDTVEDVMYHFGSKHVGRLLDFYADNNIIYFTLPLVKVGMERL